MASAEGARLGVVIPCFEAGPLLQEAVDSIREQEPVLVTVVDDASADRETAEVLARLEADAQARIIRQERNAGPSVARNAGAAATATPYVFFLDADDRLEPGALGTLAALLDAHPNAAFAFGAVRFFGAVSGVRTPPPWSPWRLLYNNFWSPSTLFRRERLLAAGGFETRSGWEDWDLFLKLAARGERGVATDRVVFSYRIADVTRLSGAQARFRDEYRALRRHHAALYARAGELRRRERPPLPERLFWPSVGLAYRLLPSSVTRAVIRRKNARSLPRGRVPSW